MKKNIIIFWAATIILIFWEGLMPLGTMLFAPEYVNAGTKPLGYPDYFAYSLIICKVLDIISKRWHIPFLYTSKSTVTI